MYRMIREFEPIRMREEHATGKSHDEALGKIDGKPGELWKTGKGVGRWIDERPSNVVAINNFSCSNESSYATLSQRGVRLRILFISWMSNGEDEKKFNNEQLKDSCEGQRRFSSALTPR